MVDKSDTAFERANYLAKRIDEARSQQPDWEKLWAEATDRAEQAEAALATANAYQCAFPDVPQQCLWPSCECDPAIKDLRLRAERAEAALAAAKGSITAMVVRDLQAEVKAANAKIAELEADGKQWAAKVGEAVAAGKTELLRLDALVTEKHASAVRADARIAELEGVNKELRDLANASAIRRDAAEKDMERAEAERDELREALEHIVAWWSLLPSGHYSPVEIEAWLSRLGKATIDKARAALATSPDAAPVGREE